ncbi:DMT family transporter [Piscinibacterium candidicorallinum]|uniref:DMT family transporter n=1 Tax=Piscinibacterium candidicorallinum TaxID=1793872 RepID=A0ABV7H6W3_9BURK
MNNNLTLRVAFLLTLPPLMWAANAVVGRMAVGVVPPVLLNLLRWTVVALLLLPLAWPVLRQPQLIRERWQHLSILGLLGMGSYNALQYLALHTSTPLNVTLIAASSPVWMLAIGAVFYKVQPRREDLIGAALSLAGVVLVISRGELDRLLSISFVVGDLLMLAAIISWGFYSWLLARPPAHMQGAARPKWDWAQFLWVQTMFGLGWCVLSAGTELAVSGEEIHWSPWVPVLLLFIAIGPSLIAYRCWGLGVASVGPAITAFFGNLTPLFAAVLSAALLGELPRLYHGLAFALIVAGIVVSARKKPV